MIDTYKVAPVVVAIVVMEFVPTVPVALSTGTVVGHLPIVLPPMEGPVVEEAVVTEFVPMDPVALSTVTAVGPAPTALVPPVVEEVLLLLLQAAHVVVEIVVTVYAPTVLAAPNTATVAIRMPIVPVQAVAVDRLVDLLLVAKLLTLPTTIIPLDFLYQALPVLTVPMV